MCSPVKRDYNTKIIYNENPLEVAKEFEAHGIEYLHLVDLDGAKSSQIVNYKILEQIASQTTLKIDFGGGLKSDADLKIAFDSGANQITGGIAIKNRALFENGFKNTVLIKLYLVRTPTMKSGHIRVVGRIR
jgi:phosphoribosylformimino-5-aminoimidazole carboxamide ribotide isomerase